ncbi:polysaccharide biosynthesis protein [Geothermobacter hydrogeniphilus]|uniref:Nucleoside-diphosphate sugar epimerase n=1 Tax=Geothermobacter hydrogeniphilus TaxID=1969733 RepID=A0A1X0XSL1_9BACT|nr:nucleoside-diphosphate sugar epimerase/dehydratase [Geothermobacter hydrogeniphilus]ORJ55885.1 nucleoside-diphosphate sugar epimerase [Geothermobacter hydrogeniphilus]
MEKTAEVLFNHRRLTVLAIKMTLICLAFLSAFALRFDLVIPGEYWSTIAALIAPLLLIKLLVFRQMGLSTGWWRYVSLADALSIFKANLVASVLFIVYVSLVHRLDNVPRSVLVLDGVLCFLFACGIRLLTRAYREDYLPFFSRSGGSRTRILVIGAGNAGQAIVRELRQNPDLNMEAVGFLDADPTKQQKSFQGVKVLGGTHELESICQAYRVDEVIIAIPSASGRAMQDLVTLCQTAGVKFKTLPGVGCLIDGRVSVQQLRDVDMEDLLGREPARLEMDEIGRYLTGKRILVSGAGGSIGSELCRQVARFKPARLILYEHAETALFHVENELRASFPQLNVLPVIGDIRDMARVDSIFAEYAPEVVFHAAAYKHVPMMECNPAEAANNNVRGTRVLADAADRYGVRNFVMISTDKAVNPTNVMGASKRAAEVYVQNLARRSMTHFVTVRFGNVLGSNGSVIPTFREQIRKGGPVTVTHPEVTRFFMSIPEAAQLVLQAGSMGNGGEIFLLDMGSSVKIVELAETMIRLSGFKPYEEIDIEFTGLRPGEKLYEELLVGGEGIKPTRHEKIRVAASTETDWDWLNRRLDDLYEASRHYLAAEVLALLQELVPEYRPVPRFPSGEVERVESFTSV